MGGRPDERQGARLRASVRQRSVELVYGIDVTNTSTHATTYDLADTLHFTDQATIQSAEVTASPAGVTLIDPAWDGQDNTGIALGVPLIGTDDAGYAPHRYEVTVVADVPLQQIGRAAWRGSECEYGKMSGGGGTRTKK